MPEDGFTWLTVAELSRRLGRARSTIRLWQDQQRAWAPVRLNAAGHQLYPLERIEEIAMLAAQKLSPREIAAVLERRHGEAAEGAEDDTIVSWEDAVLDRLDRILDAVERIADHLAPRDS